MQDYLKYISLIARIVVILAVLTSMVAVMNGDLFASLEDHCDETCQNDCDDSCDTCGDCAHCLPTMHLLSAYTGQLDLLIDTRPDTVIVPTFRNESRFADGIDHPPQLSA